MNSNKLLTLREDKKKSGDITYTLTIARMDSEQNSLEASPKEFLELSYPSKSIKEIITIIDKKMRGVKITDNNHAATVLSGNKGLGKTHTLLTAYNLFNHFNSTKKWIDKNNIKFNKFNIVNVKKSKSCIISPLSEEEEKIWVTIFKKLGEEELLEDKNEVPDISLITQLVSQKYIVILIDDFKEFCIKLLKEKKVDLFEKNRLFLSNLIDAACKSNKFIIFISKSGEINESIDSIFNKKEVLIKNISQINEQIKFIPYYLFKEKSIKEFEKIEEKIDLYLQKLIENEIELENEAVLKDRLLNSYPFHPKLIKILIRVYQKQANINPIGILRDLFMAKGSKIDLFLLADLEVDTINKFFPESSNYLEVALKKFSGDNKEYWTMILKTIFLCTNFFWQEGASKEEIFRLLIRPETDNDISQLNRALEKLLEKVDCLEIKDGLYSMKESKKVSLPSPNKSVLVADLAKNKNLKTNKSFLSIKEEINQLSKEKLKEELVDFIMHSSFAKKFKIYPGSEIKDDSTIKYILLLKDFETDKELKGYLNKKIYSNRKFQNNLVIVKSKTKLFSGENIEILKKILFLKKIIVKEEQSHFEQVLKKEKKKLNRTLKSKFKYYLEWKDSKGNYILNKKEVKLEEINRQIEADITTLKKDLLAKFKTDKRDNIEEILLKYKKNRAYPLVIDDAKFYQAAKVLKNKRKRVSKQKINRENILKKIKQDNKKHRKKEKVNTSSLIKDTIAEITYDEVYKALGHFIAKHLFNKNYKVYGCDQIKDSREIKRVLLIEQPDNLVDFLNNKIYKNRKFKNTLIIIKADEKILTSENISEMKLIMAFNRIEDQISWKKEKVNFVLKQKKVALISKLKTAFGSYLYWVEKGDEVKLKQQKIANNNLEIIIEHDLVSLKKDILKRLKKVIKITFKELLIKYEKNMTYPLIVKKELFEQAVNELKEEGQILIDNSTDKKYLVSLKEKANNIATKDSKKELVYFLKNNIFSKEYKVIDYDELEDSPNLEYILLLDYFEDEQELENILKEKVYDKRIFKNNLIILMPKSNLFIQKIFSKINQIIVFKNIIESKAEENLFANYLDKIKKELKKILTEKFAYYLNWQKDNDNYYIYKKEINPKNVIQEIKIPNQTLKKHLSQTINKKKIIGIEELLLEYSKKIAYPLLINKKVFYKLLKELENEQKLVVARETETIYISINKLIKDKSKNIESKQLQKELIKFIKQEISYKEYKIYDYDEIKDDEKLKFVLLLEDSITEELDKFIENNIYKDRKYKNRLVLFKFKEKIFRDKYLNKIGLIIAASQLNYKQGWQKEEITLFLNEISNQLNTELKTIETDHLYWRKEKNNLKLEKQEIKQNQLLKIIESDLNELKKDIIKRMTNIEVITASKLLLRYKKDISFKQIINDNTFNQAIKELNDNNQIFIKDKADKSYLVCLEKNGELINKKQLKKELAKFIRENLFSKKYKIYGYDQIADNIDLKYVLLLESFKQKEKLAKYLKQNFYSQREFENSLVLIQAKTDIFTKNIMNQIETIIIFEKLVKFKREIFYESLIDKKESLLLELKEKFAYYLYWEKDKEKYNLIRKEIDLENIAEIVKTDRSVLKEHLFSYLKSKHTVVFKNLLNEYRKFRDFPLIVNEDLLQEIINELKTSNKLIVSENNNKIYFNTKSLLQDTIANINLDEAKEKLAYFIRDNLFSPQYKIYGYDQIEDKQELQYVLLFKPLHEGEVINFLKENIYEQLKFKQSVVILKTKQDIYQAKYLEKMKLIIGIRQAQEKISWDDRKIALVLEKQKESLVKILEDSHISYLYCKEEEAELEFHEEKIGN